MKSKRGDTCPSCNAAVKPGAARCRKCGRDLRSGQAKSSEPLWYSRADRSDRKPYYYSEFLSYWPRGPFPPFLLRLLMIGVVLVGGVALWFRFNAPPGRLGEKVFPADLIFYYYPMTEYASERLAKGDLPLWNPQQCCGVPFLATAQVAVFYPGTWLSLVMPVGTALKTLMFGEVLLGGLFAALFFRALGVSHYAAGIGGVLFIFACILGQTFWPPEVSAIMWMPLLFLCVEKFVRQGKWRWWAAFTVATTLQILAGFPQFLVYTFYLLGPYAIVRLVHCSIGGQYESDQLIRRGVGLGFACALALGLAGAQVLPTKELVDNSARGEGLAEQEVQYLEQTGWKPPDAEQIAHNAFDPRPKLIAFDFLNDAGYLGMATLFMIALAIVVGWRKHLTWFFLIAAGASLLLSFGYHLWSGWLYRLYEALPTGSMFRTPTRFKLLTFFSLISLAVFGIDQFRTGLPELRRDRTLRLAAGLAGIVVLALACRLSTPLGIVLALVAAGLLAGSFFLFRHAWAPVALAAGLLVLLLFDLAHATGRCGVLRDIPVQWGQCLHFRGAGLVRPWAFAGIVTDKEKVPGHSRICPLYLKPVKVIRPLERFYSVCDYEALLPKRWTLAGRAMGGDRWRTMYRVDRRRFEGFYDMASVTYLVVPRGPKKYMDPRGWDWDRYDFKTWAPEGAPPELRAAEYRNRDALPRAYLVSRFDVCGPEEALSRIAAGNFEYQTTVLLEKAPGMVPLSDSPAREPATIVSYSPERVEIQTRSQGERLLVLTDTYFPGWKAFVDGVPTEILRANYLFRAVRVRSGLHTVVFEYQPASFRNGVALSLTSLAGFAVLSAASWFRGRRAGQPAAKASTRGPTPKPSRGARRARAR